MKLNKKWFLLLIPIALIAGAAIYYSNSTRNFEVLRPTQGEITEAVYGLGKVKSNRRYDVKAGVLTSVTDRFHDEGDFVTKGEKLIQLESTLFRAPFSGTITLVSVFKGETVTPNTTVLRLEDLKDRYIELVLEQESALRIRPGQDAKVTFESVRNKILHGKVTNAFSRNDEFIVTVNVEQLDDNILPGMTADVSVEIGKIQGLLVPFQAIRNGMVLIRRDGRQQKVKVEVGLVDGLSAEIKGDSIKSDDEILIPRK